MFKHVLIGSLALAVLLFGHLPALAQTSAPESQGQQVSPAEISDRELEQFASAIQEMQSIQEAAEADMIAAVQEQGLSAERFVEIARSQQDPEAQPEESVSQEELQNFQEASSQIAQIQEDMQSQLQEAVQSEGLEVQRFNEIFAAVRQNPTLMEKVQQML